MTDRDQRLLTYIAESIQLVNGYVAEGGRRAFEDDTLIQDAVLRRLETLAEAAGRLSATVKDRQPQVPWREVYGFRNIAAHAYLDLHLDRTWEIIERYLPLLDAAVRAELQRFAAPSERHDL